MTTKAEIARAMRAEGRSVGEIAAAILAAKSSVSRWVRDVPLSEEQRAKLRHDSGRAGFSESRKTYLRLAAIGRREASQQRGRAAAKLNDPLHRDGCMLYWGEGTKVQYAVAFTNSDAGMVSHFARFLRECLGVTDAEMRVSINCHLDHGLSLEEVQDYWLSVLRLSRSAIRKGTVVAGKPDSPGRHKKLKYGTCSLRVTRNEYLHHILGAIQEYTGLSYPDWLTRSFDTHGPDGD